MNNMTDQYEHWMLLVKMLQEIAKQNNITQETIACKTGIKQSNVSRIFSLKYCPSLSNFIAIANAVGVNFFFEDKSSKTDLNKAFECAMSQLGRRPDMLQKN